MIDKSTVNTIIRNTRAQYEVARINATHRLVYDCDVIGNMSVENGLLDRFNGANTRVSGGMIRTGISVNNFLNNE